MLRPHDITAPRLKTGRFVIAVDDNFLVSDVPKESWRQSMPLSPAALNKLRGLLLLFGFFMFNPRQFSF
jgi:hypothetical protein